MQLIEIAKLLRIKHWVKNALVFFPLVFSGRFLEPQALLGGCLAFVAFCFASSFVYVLNDAKDIEADRLHPTKRNRPLASGAVRIPVAVVLAIVMLVIALAVTLGCAQKPWHSFALLALYIVLNVAYSFGAKNVPVVDVGILAAGFLLRVLFGGTFCGIPISSWLFLTVLSLAFYFALGKRRGELERHGSDARKSLQGARGYNVSFLDKNMYVFLACGFVFYSLWTFERIGSFSASFNFSTLLFVLGIPLAMLICMRYSLDVESEDSDGDPVTTVFSDRPLLALIVLWVVIMFLSVYVGAVW